MAELEWVATDTLQVWTANPRRNDGPPVAAVAASIERFGFGSPIVARRANREVIAGHARLKAARKLGLSTVPVRWLDLSESEAHALALVDNKTAELAKWDVHLLVQVLGEVEVDGFDVDALTAALNPEPSALSDPTACYALTFDDEQQKSTWECLLRSVRAKFPNETLGAGLIRMVSDDA